MKSDIRFLDCKNSNPLAITGRHGTWIERFDTLLVWSRATRLIDVCARPKQDPATNGA